MTLWTIQSLPAWAELQRQGVLRATTRNATETAWLPAYRWMTQQMRSRIGPPPETDSQPIWAWYQWHGARRMPDLRYRGHLPEGETGVRLKLEFPAQRALLSDFSLWHHVLNYWHLPPSIAEGDAFESDLASLGLSYFTQKPLPDETNHRRIVQSWERIFDLDWYAPEISAPTEDKSIQGTMWEIALDQVRECRHFTAR